MLQRLLAKGGKVNLQHEEQYTPMLIAAKNGHLGVVNVRVTCSFLNSLLGMNSSLLGLSKSNLKIQENYLTLFWIIVEQALLAWGATVDARDRNQSTALIWASMFGHLAIVEVGLFLQTYWTHLSITVSLGCFFTVLDKFWVYPWYGEKKYCRTGAHSPRSNHWCTQHMANNGLNVGIWVWPLANSWGALYS